MALTQNGLKNEDSFLDPKYFFSHVGKSGMYATKRSPFCRRHIWNIWFCENLYSNISLCKSSEL